MPTIAEFSGIQQELFTFFPGELQRFDILVIIRQHGCCHVWILEVMDDVVEVMESIGMIDCG